MRPQQAYLVVIRTANYPVAHRINSTLDGEIKATAAAHPVERNVFGLSSRQAVDGSDAGAGVIRGYAAVSSLTGLLQPISKFASSSGLNSDRICSCVGS